VVPQSKGEEPSLPIGDAAMNLGEGWQDTAAGDKQPHEHEVSELKDKQKRIVLPIKLQENLL
jgi:hypothetical protein